MTNEFQVVKTAVEAVLDANLFEDEAWKSVSYARTLSSVAVVGSTNIGDFGIELWAGNARKGIFFNTAGGANVVPVRDDEKFPKILVPANNELQCKVIDAALANNVVVQVKFDSARQFKRRFGGYQQGGFSGQTDRFGRPIRNPAAYAAAVARSRGRGYA